jgi:hypothetical protein
MEHSRPQQETAYTLSRLLPNTKEEACRLLVYKDLFWKFLLLLFFFKKKKRTKCSVRLRTFPWFFSFLPSVTSRVVLLLRRQRMYATNVQLLTGRTSSLLYCVEPHHHAMLVINLQQRVSSYSSFSSSSLVDSLSCWTGLSGRRRRE